MTGLPVEGTARGVGKTTVTLMLLALLRGQGLAPQQQSEGFIHHGIPAWYVHRHFGSAPEVASNIVAAARQAHAVPGVPAR